ncbi:hypothetical protein BCR42DRAFT_409973 [Absidia repens]|uniref:Arrestin C-terminal-like domain-containing protein n=1 Tax=Absidia repens TaxID=90262 RepID=A0A1X2INE6_9FUNG|nr:hypothetical protein BCR42DRAFT_409973 [Absidia repens]
MVFSGPELNINLESDHLVMHGRANESSGCVLRGVLNIHLKQSMKIKSVTLIFSGTIQTSWKQPTGNGHERRIQQERSLITHRWPFISPTYDKTHVLTAGDHTYDFELPLTGDLPETGNVANYYNVHYQLEAIIQRSHFLPNYECQRVVYVTRQLNSTPSYSSLIEPISVDNQWSNKLYYDISIPSKLFHHGDVIPVAINFIPLVRGLKISHLNCTFKEYATCGPVDGLFDGRSKSHSKILYYTRNNQPAKGKVTDSSDSNGNPVTTSNDDDDNGAPWCLNLAVPIPKALDEIQCDTSGGVVHIRHQLKFVLTMARRSGRLTELHAVLPIIIQAKPNGLLPTYNQCDGNQTYPYDPALMVRLLRRNQQQQQQNHISRSPQEDEMQQPSSSIDHTALATTSIQASQSNEITSNLDNHPSHHSILSSSSHSPLASDNPPISSASRLPTYDEVHCH